VTTLEARRAAARERQELATTLPAPLYIQACPGAGKTRVIVNRHLATAHAGGARGRAVVSFTNVACDEVVHRCRDAGKPQLTAFPHYVGTIDTFLWRYLVRPFLSGDRIWNRIDSWDRIGATVSVWQGQICHKLRLSDFLWSREPDETQCQAQLVRKTRNIKAYLALAKADQLDAAGRAAVRRRDQLATKGYITGHEARIRAMRMLRNHRSHAIGIISSRFDEIVIDEAQDCSALDLAILTELRNAGVPIVFVCDPDQAIYEFRGAQPENVRTFGTTLGSRVDLVGNWRSSPAICAFAATLRPPGTRATDDPVGPHHDDGAGVLLIPAKNPRDEQTLARFNQHADALGIAAERRLVLAHAAATLPSVARGGPSTPPDNHSARAAWAASVLGASIASKTLRETAFEVFERLILHYWYTESDVDNRTVAAACEHLGLDPSQLRQLAARLASDLPDLDRTPFGAWCAAANARLRQSAPEPGPRRDASGSLRAGNMADKTTRAAGGAPGPTLDQAIRTNIIHQVKGEEEDAVLVVVPEDTRTGTRTHDLIEAWLSDDHTTAVAESLRVLYVASTRARRLLALTFPEAYRDRVAAYLNDRAVPFDMTTRGAITPVVRAGC
jgi:DNA helicase-2/ATP-dependent DNA helicase PcrA